MSLLPRLARGPEDISKGLLSLCNYCSVFGADETSQFAQCLFRFVQQLLGEDTWAQDDLPHIVFWLNSLLKQFRTSAVHDLNGGSSRRDVDASITQTNPSYEDMVRRLMQRALKLATEQAKPRHLPANSHHEQATPSERAVKRESRQQHPSNGTPTSSFAAISSEIPRPNNRELCLKSISAQPCRGVAGNRSQCKHENRIHFDPQQLTPGVRKYIVQRLGGLRDDLQHL